MSPADPFGLFHGIGDRVGSLVQGTGSPAVGDKDDHGVLVRILAVKHVQHVFRLKESLGQRCLASGRHGSQFLLGKVYGPCDRKKDFRLFFAESHHTYPVSFLIGIQKDFENDPFHRFHSFSGAHGAAGIYNKEENISGPLFTDLATKIFFPDNHSTAVGRSCPLVGRCSAEGGIEGNVRCFGPGDFRPYVASLHEICHGETSFAASFFRFPVFRRFYPHRRQIHMKVRIVNALPALTAGIGHLRIVFILLMIAVICILRIHLGRLGFWRMAEFSFRCAWLFRLFFRRSVFFLLLLGLHIFRRLLFFRFPHAMGQDEFRSLFQILGEYVLSSRQSGFGPGRFNEVNISPVACHMGFQGIYCRQLHHGIRNFHTAQRFSSLFHFLFQGFRFFLPLGPESDAVLFKGQHPADDFLSCLFIAGGVSLCKKAEPVQGRGGKGAAIRIHYSQYGEGGLPFLRKTVSFQPVSAGFADVQHRRKEIVPKEVYIIHINNALIRFVNQSGKEFFMTAADSLFCIDGTKEPVFRDTDRDFHPGSIHQFPGASHQGGLAAAFFSGQEEAAGKGVHQGEEDGFFGFFHAADSGKRKYITLHRQ